MTTDITSLPAELLLLILKQLSCPDDLSNMILASKVWYLVFKYNKRNIKLHILHNTVTPEVEADFCLAVCAQNMVDVHYAPFSRENASIRFQLECLGFLEDVLAGQHPNLEELANDFPIDKLLRTAQLFHALVYYYAFKTLKKLNKAEGPGAPLTPVPLSYIEKRRIMRAFCRHEVYVSLLPCWMYMDDAVRGLRASQSAPTFLDQFTPWEREEIGCIDQFLQDTIGEAIDELEDYVVSLLELKQDYILAEQRNTNLPTLGINVSNWSEQFRRCGVHTVQGSYERGWRCHHFASKGIRKVFEMFVDPHLRMVLQSSYGNEFPPPLFGTMNPIKLPRTYIERDGDPELKEPTAAWSWAFGDRTPAVMARVNKPLRSCGYVFWDDDRLLQYQTFQNPRVLGHVNDTDWDAERQFPRHYKVVSPALEEKMKNVKLSPLVVSRLLDTMRENTLGEMKLRAR